MTRSSNIHHRYLSAVSTAFLCHPCSALAPSPQKRRPVVLSRDAHADLQSKDTRAKRNKVEIIILVMQPRCLGLESSPVILIDIMSLQG